MYYDFALAAAQVALPVLAFLELKSMIGVTRQNTAKIIARFGRYVKATTPGLYVKKPWPFEMVADTLSTKVQVADLSIAIKTKDNAFVRLPVKIHYAIEDAIKSTRLANVRQQMDTLVQNVIRSHFADQELTGVYQARNEMAQVVKQELPEKMAEYGLRIADVVVENPEIPDDLQKALQSVIVSTNNLAATRNNAEATRTTLLAQATGQAQSRKAIGKGIADEQRAIARGLKDSIGDMKEAGISVDRAMNFIQMTNHQQRDLQIAEQYAKIGKAVLFATVPNTENGKNGTADISEEDIKKLVTYITATRPAVDAVDAVGSDGKGPAVH